MERQRKDPERADPMTRVIARRVRHLRKERRMSGAELSAAVRRLGLHTWVDSTVGKLETHRRETVNARELMALALALRVPPPLLLADPTSDDPVPIAEGIDADPWSTLLWLIGGQPPHEPSDRAWSDESEFLAALHRLASTINAYKRNQGILEEPGGEGSEQVELLWLKRISAELAEFERHRWPSPPLPEHVLKRAADLDIDLDPAGQS